MNKQLDNMRVYFTVLRMSNSLHKKTNLNTAIYIVVINSKTKSNALNYF